MALDTEGRPGSEPGKESKMGVPHITSFCWCLGLEVGARIIAVLHLITSLVLVVLCSVYAVKFGEQVGTVEDAGDHLYTAWYNISVTVAVVSVCHFLLACTLLYGVYKRCTGALRVWVWVMTALVVVSIVFDIAGLAVWGAAGTGSDIFLAFLQGVIFFGVLAYCILCVNSYYLMLKSCEDMQGPSHTPY